MKYSFLIVFSAICHAASPFECGNATGSWGEFTPAAFTKAQVPWQVYRAVGQVSKSGFPCDMRGNSCFLSKEYSFFEVARMETERCMDIGVNGAPMLDVKREASGTYRKVEIARPGVPIPILRMDGNRASSRLGADAAETVTLSRPQGNGLYLHGGLLTLGHTESKSAAWATLGPHSFYYRDTGTSKSVFGLTVVEELMFGGVVTNYLAGTPRKERMRSGTYWCQSDQWDPKDQGFVSLLKNDEFNMTNCHGNKLLSSESKRNFINVASGFFMNRMDSTVTVHGLNDYQYDVETRTQWPCFIDCDGSTYKIHLPNFKNAIHINSDRWNWQSSTGFKVKVIRIDWDRDGFVALAPDTDLRVLATNPTIYKDIVAVVVNESKDTQGNTSSQGQWTSHSYIMFPPKAPVPQDYSDNLKKIKPEISDALIRMTYQIRLLDAVLAMMPDQSQTSPELADIEEKLDELRLWVNLELFEEKNGWSAISPDLAFDVLSETDSTTAVTWHRPNASGAVQGKIEWLLKTLRAI